MNKILLLAIYFTQISPAKPHTVTQIKIISIPIFTTTSIRVSCDQFDYEFNNDEKKTVLLNKSVDIKKINLLVLKEQLNASNGIDVRGEILLYYYNNKIKKICFDQFGIFFDGTKYFENKLLFQFLLDSNFIGY